MWVHQGCSCPFTGAGLFAEWSGSGPALGAEACIPSTPCSAGKGTPPLGDGCFLQKPLRRIGPSARRLFGKRSRNHRLGGGAVGEGREVREAVFMRRFGCGRRGAPSADSLGEAGDVVRCGAVLQWGARRGCACPHFCWLAGEGCSLGG